MAIDQYGGGHSTSGPQPDPDGHPDVELLDAYADSDPSARAIEPHVACCPSCQEAVEALRQVRAELARLASLTMPADVARRIQAAIAASAAADAGRESTPEHDQARQDLAEQPPGNQSGTAAPLAGRLTAAPPADPAQSTPGQPGTGGLARPSPLSGLPGPAGPLSPPGGRDGRGPRDRRGWPAARRLHGIGPGGRRPGGSRGPGGPPRAPRRAGGRDWVSVAAVCVALVAFGAAVLVYRGFQQPAADSSATIASAARPDSAVEMAPGVAADSAAGPVESPPDAAAQASPPPSDSPFLGYGGEGPGGEKGLIGQDSGLTAVTDSGRRLTSDDDVLAHSREILRGLVPVVGLLSIGEPEHLPATARSAAPTSLPSQEQTFADASAHPVLKIIDTAALRMCYDSLAAETGGRLLAIDRIYFDDQPALLILLSVTSKPTVTRLVVLDLGCGVTSPPNSQLYSALASRT